MFKKLSLLLVFCMLSTSLMGVVPAVRAEGDALENLIPNSGFEQTESDADWLNGSAASDWGVWFATPGGVVSVSQDVYYSGQQALKIEHSGSARTSVSLDGGVMVEAGRSYKLGAWLKTENVSNNAILRTYYYNGLSKVSDGPRVYLKNSMDWINKELPIAVPEEANVLRVELMFETGTGTVWLDDVSLIPTDVITSLELDASSLEFNKDEQHTLNVTILPDHSVDKTVVWSSSDPSIVEVNNGMLIAKDYGSVVIRVSTPDGTLYDECNVNVIRSDDDNLIPNPGFEVTLTHEDWLNGTAASDWGIWFATPGGIVSVSEDVYYSGQQALKIEHSESARTNVSIDGGVTVEAERDYMLEAWLKIDNVLSDKGVILRTYYYDGLSKVSNGPTASFEGSMDWTFQELFVTVPAEANVLRVELMFETGTGTVWMDDVSLKPTVPVDDDPIMPTVQMDQGTVSMSPGQNLTLTPLVHPSTSEQSFTWTSSDPAVATVTDGIVEAVAVGRTLIEVVSGDGNLTAQTSVTVIPEADMLEFQKLRERVAKKLTVPDGVDTSAHYVQQYLEQKMNLVHNDQNTGYMDTLDRSGDRTYLWADRASETDPYITLYNYGRLKDMAIIYSIPGSPLYGDTGLRDDIIGGMDWLYLNRYNENKPVVGNWFVWEISIPQSLGELMILMHDDLLQDQLNNYIRALDHFVPDPTLRPSLNNETFRETGANLLNKSYAVALRGLAGDSSEKIELAQEPVGNEYQYVDSGEGLYSDGSIIQHTNVAYNGGYGQSYISQAELLLYMFFDSPWEMTDPLIQNVYESVTAAFDPFIVDGRFMQMVNGRASSGGSGNAKGFILAALQLAETAPMGKVLPLKESIKAWIHEDTSNDYTTGLTVYQRSLYEKLINDSSIIPRDGRVGHTQFTNMDRTLHERQGWKLGLSLFSERVSAFEYGNTENIKGWFTGVGMTYLYDADKNTEDPATRNFVSMAFNHGSDPTNDSYAYVLLPGKTVAQTTSYSANPDVTILSQTDDVHAVQENNLGITAANFWNAGNAGFITSNQPASVMVQDSNDTWSVSVSDPTHKQAMIELHLDQAAVSVISKDPRIEVIQLSPVIKLSVNVDGAMGEALTAKFNLPSKSEPEPEPEPEPDEESGSDSQPSVDSPSAQVPYYSQGAIRAIPVMVEDQAVTKVTKQVLDEAFQHALPDSKGVAKAIIKVSAVEGVGRYVLQFPADMVSSIEENKRIRLETPVGIVVVPNHMFKQADVSGQESIAISIGTVDPSTIDPQLAQFIGTKPVIELHVEAGGKPIKWENKDAPVTVVLNFEPSPQEHAEYEHLVVWYINEQGEAIPIPNGGFNVDKQQVEFTTTHFSQYAVAFVKKTFSDIAAHTWAKKEIEILASKGVIKGMTDESYAPDAAISRADFVLMLIRALELQSEVTEQFDDVQPDDYYYEGLGIAKSIGLAAGKGDSQFSPEEDITRQEMMVLANRALLLAKKSIASGALSDLEPYADAPKLADYAVRAVASLVKEGYIVGNGTQLNPLDFSTRAEAAVLIYKLYSK